MSAAPKFAFTRSGGTEAEPLYRCEVCLRAGFSLRGLKSHTCRPRGGEGQRAKSGEWKTPPHIARYVAEDGHTTFGTLAGAATQNPKDTQDMTSPDATQTVEAAEPVSPGGSTSKGTRKPEPKAGQKFTVGQAVSLDPNTMELHPVLLAFPQPEWSEDSEDFGGIVASVRDQGFDYPLMVCPQGRIIDGRHRRRAGVALGLERVPCVVVPEEKAMEKVVSTFFHRRHLTRGAVCYYLAPFCQEAANLGKRNRGLKNLNISPKNPVGEIFGKLVTGKGDFCKQMAVPESLMDKALITLRTVSELEETGLTLRDPGLPGDETLYPVRKVVERMLFERQMGLTEVNRFLGNSVGLVNLNEAERAQKLSRRADPAFQVPKRMEEIATHWKHWDRVPELERASVYNALPALVKSLPEDVFSQLAIYVRARKSAGGAGA